MKTLTIAAFLGLCVTANADPTETFEFFFKAQDSVLSPGEKLNFELWGRLKPGVGEPAIANGFTPNTPPLPATVGWFVSADFTLWTLSTAGNWISAAKNPDPNYLALPGIGTFYDYGVTNINLTNKGVKATEFLMYSYVWEPKVYQNEVMTLSIKSAPPAVTLILDDSGLPFTESWAWAVDEFDVTITPSPGVGMAGVVALSFAMIRRRR